MECRITDQRVSNDPQDEVFFGHDSNSDSSVYSLADRIEIINKNNKCKYHKSHLIWEAVGPDGAVDSEGGWESVGDKIIELIDQENDAQLGKLLREQAEAYLASY